MRQCIEFGYHHETPSNAQVNPLEVDMKRRLFWMAYKLDRQLCFNLGRPPMISDEFINVPVSPNPPLASSLFPPVSR